MTVQEQTEVTAWLRPTDKPVRTGWYEVKWSYDGARELWFNYWDGSHWYWGWKSMRDIRWPPDEYSRVRPLKGVRMLCWRGLCRPNVRANRPEE